MQKIVIIVLLILAIPVAAIIDFFLFGSLLGARGWTDFIVPCALEIFSFLAGYMIRDKECRMEKEGTA
jgi:hypothetical protein